MTDHRKDHQIHEPLIDKAADTGAFPITKEELSDLFHPDNIDKKSSEDPEVSISVYRLWHKYGGQAGLAKLLQTDLKTGIHGDDKDLQLRKKEFGSNANILAETKTLLDLIIECFEDLMLKILLLAAFVALIIGIINDGLEHGWIEGASIFFAVGIIVTVTAGNNYLKEKQFQQLKARQQDNQNVAIFRGVEGGTITRSTQEIVVGDIIKIEQGAQVPADSIVIYANDLVLNESAQTGEPKDKDKKPVTQENYSENPIPFLLAKTFVKSGEGLALVCAVGVNTRAGMAGEKLDMENGQTPLQQKLETIANQIGKVGLTVAILTFCIMTVKYVLTEQFREFPQECTNEEYKKLHSDLCNGLEFMDLLKEIVHYFIIAITVVVVAMPEGLPLAVTISLAYSVMKMKQENNLVRKLEASETMGGADQICTDKTGTLTQNKMTVRGIWTQDQVFVNDSIDTVKLSNFAAKELLSTGILYNCSARVEHDKKTGLLEVNGNCTEQGIIQFLMKQGEPALDILRQKNDDLPDGRKRIVESIPFNSKRKKQTTAILLPGNEQTVRIFVKGAPDFVLEDCDKYIDATGSAVPLSEPKKAEILEQIIKKQFAFNAFRTLLISYTDISIDRFNQLKASNNNFEKEANREVLEKQGLTVIGIYGLQDPLRVEIVDSVHKCHKAGITIRMVTGDNLDTAIAIARNAGILQSHEEGNQYACMEGKQFRELVGLNKIKDKEGKVIREEIKNKEVFRRIEPQLRVLARSTPEDKYILVTGLQELNKVVAVTGDGTNDAPALKKADVGFAMGIAGTEVAKDASDIVILDDNFASIVTAIKWGRNIYQNVRKFLQFQLTVNVVAMFIVFIGSVVLRDPPLTSVQMLWVNLIMDTCGALALATEPPNDSLLDKKPYPRNESIVKPTMVRNILGQAFYQMIVLLVLLFAGKDIFDLHYNETDGFYGKKQDSDGKWVIDINNPTVDKLKHYTLIFHSFVFMQIFNEINARKLGKFQYNVFEGFFNNFLFLSIILATVGIQVCMVQFGGASIRTIPLPMEQHLICLGIGMFSLINGLIVKALLPTSWFKWIKIKEEPMPEEEADKSLKSIMRKPTFSKSQHNRSKVVDHQAPSNGPVHTAIN